MREIIAVINQKGGVGKTTTALGLGFGLKHKGYKVLFIDLDAQGNLSYTLGAQEPGVSALDVLTKGADPHQAIVKTENGEIIASTPLLAGVEITSTGKQYRLMEAIQPIKANYDYIVIDTPPALGILTINAMTASTGLIIPAQADGYSLQGIKQLYDSIGAIKTFCNSELKVFGILLTRHNTRAILSREVRETIGELARNLDTKLFKTIIRECIAIKEAEITQRDLFKYASRSNGAKDYMAFVNEFLKGSKSNG